MKYALLAIVLVAAASLATYVRYESLDPCDWLEQDMVQQTGLPRLAVQVKIRAEFLLEQITDPGPADCLSAWWEMRAETLSEES